MNVETRQKIEKRIVKKIIEDALAAGYDVSVHNGGDDYEYTGTDKKRILEELFACDEEWLCLHKDGKYQGEVYLIYGNDGYDVICDYSVSLEEVLKGANELANKLANQYG